MTDPESALEQARTAAATMRSRGAYAEDLSGFRLRPEPLTIGKLMEWSVIEPDLRDVRSTRRYGAPITAFKHFLVRMLQQYQNEVLAQQTRFNVAVVTRLGQLEGRLERLERGEGVEVGEPGEASTRGEAATRGEASTRGEAATRGEAP